MHMKRGDKARKKGAGNQKSQESSIRRSFMFMKTLPQVVGVNNS